MSKKRLITLMLLWDRIFTDTITIKRQLLINIDILHTSHMITD